MSKKKKMVVSPSSTSKKEKVTFPIKQSTLKKDSIKLTESDEDLDKILQSGVKRPGNKAELDSDIDDLFPNLEADLASLEAKLGDLELDNIDFNLQDDELPEIFSN